jgi:hypothetical protein
MHKPVPFRLNRQGVLLALVSAAFAGEAGAAAGRAEFAIGGVTVAGRDGVQRPLARGTELDNGDVVRTNNGRAQIRFTDGAYVSLQPNTEFGIRDYRYQNKTDGSERGFFGLLKGAMRTVTGAIGRINRDRYQIATPTATVGIRGTGGVIQVQDDGSTLVIGTSGIWSLTNPAGSVDVPGGTSAVAPADPNEPPQETTQQPTSGPTPVPEEEPIFIAGEEKDETGLPVIPPPPFTPLASGPGYDAIAAYNIGTSAFGSPDGPEGSAGYTATFDSQGQLTRIDDRFGGLVFALESGGSHANFGSDGVLAWGRWIGPVTVGGRVETYGTNTGFHYVVGMPTATMPTTGTATYSLISGGATPPTYADGRSAPGTFTGSLAVDFSGATTVTGNFNVSMTDGKGYQWTGATSISGYSFFISNFGGVTGSGGACGGACGCDAFVHGFFAGTNAERAGIGYRIDDSTTQVIGAAALKKD